MFNLIRFYIRWQSALWDAQRLCDGHPNLTDAILALSFLNPTARDENNEHRFSIYHLKTHLIRVLYQAGLAESVSLKIQHLACRACRGRGEFYSGICQRCWGTGVRRKINLYEFVFRFGGREFIWHQPEDMILYPVTLTTSEIGNYHAAGQALIRQSEQKVLTNIAVLYLYLASAGVELTSLPIMSPSWRTCLQFDLRSLRNHVRYHLAQSFSLCEFCHRPEMIAGHCVGDHSRCYPF